MLNDPKPELMRTLKSNELLPPISQWTWLGGLAMIAGCSLIALLAVNTRYNQTVKASIVVRPSGETRWVQAAVEGRIRSIQVVENQMVKQGDVIAYLEDSQAQTQTNQLQEKIRQGQQQVAEIEQQIQSLNVQILAEFRYLERTINSVQADLSRNQQDYRDRQVVNQTDLKEAVANLKLAQNERDRYLSIVETGAIPRIQYEAKEQAVAVAQARLEQAQATLNPNNDNITIATERIAQERAKGESTLANLRREQQALQQRRLELLGQVNQAQTESNQTAIDRKKAVLRAPIAGKILKLALRNPDQVVQRGETVAEISPDRNDAQNALVVKAFVSAEDIGKVAVGQTAHLRISAYPYPDYGGLTGTVQTIAPDSRPQSSRAIDPTAPPIDRRNVYEVTIQPKIADFQGRNQSAITRDRPLIQAGMEGNVDIVTQEDTVLRFILRKARLLTDQ
jgi:multidrug efflux pump subunit AcrA (membrane-fusion protein)